MGLFATYMSFVPIKTSLYIFFLLTFMNFFMYSGNKQLVMHFLHIFSISLWLVFLLSCVFQRAKGFNMSQNFLLYFILEILGF